METTPRYKAHVEGVGFEGVTAVYSLTVREGVDKDGPEIATIWFRRYTVGERRSFLDLVETALEDLGWGRRVGPFVPHNGSWECWCAPLEA